MFVLIARYPHDQYIAHDALANAFAQYAYENPLAWSKIVDFRIEWLFDDPPP